MGRSQETFSKKEKEKKKQLKKRDKEQRKEERARNSRDGSDLDAMIAYVDDNGNITNTPPDPTRKKTAAKAEDIQIGVPRQAPTEPEDPIRRGTVTFFNDSKGYGFIRDAASQESIFVHVNGVTEPIAEQDKVVFEIEMGHKGPNAVRVRIDR